MWFTPLLRVPRPRSFSVPVPGCYTGLYLADQQQFPVTVGNSQTGVSVGYGACLGEPINVIGVQLFNSGTTPPCCQWDVLPDPNLPSGNIEVVDCGGGLVTANGKPGFINGDANCPCTVATEDATWGQVKQIYSID